MAKDFSEIPDTIHDVKDAFIRGVLFARRKLVVNLVVDLARNTPVDTSKALSNWEVGATSSKFSYGSAHVKGKRGSTREASIALTKAAADRESSSIPLKDPVHVANSLALLITLSLAVLSIQGSGRCFDQPASVSYTHLTLPTTPYV